MVIETKWFSNSAVGSEFKTLRRLFYVIKCFREVDVSQASSEVRILSGSRNVLYSQHVVCFQ